MSILSYLSPKLNWISRNLEAETWGTSLWAVNIFDQF